MIDIINCVYCKTASFEVGKGSLEHAILSSLGGRKSSRNICCENCNNRLGSEIDNAFNELSFISTMLGIKTGRNRDAPLQKNFIEHEGEKYNLNPIGKLSLSKTSVKFKNKDILGKEEFSIGAPNREEALKKLDQVLKKYDKSIDDLPELKATHIKTYLPEQTKSLNLGTDKQFRAAAKMLLTYLSTIIRPQEIRNGQFDQVINYIAQGNNGYDLCFWDFVSPVPQEPKLSETNHRLFIFASKEKKIVFGILELFGYLKYSAVLTDQWNGEDINQVYVVNPITREQEESEIYAPDQVFDFIDDRKLEKNFKNQCCSAIAKIIKAAQEKQSQQIISDIVKKALKKHITSEDEIIAKDMLDNFIEEISIEFTKFICRISSKGVIDLLMPTGE